MNVHGTGYTDRLLTDSEIRNIVEAALEEIEVQNARVLIIIPDGTRSGPIDKFFHLFYELLADAVSASDYMIALGTHPLMPAEARYRRVGITAQEKHTKYQHVNILNHRWDKPETFKTVGVISQKEIEQLSEGRLAREVEVTVNKRIYEYDFIFICGPVFPHEVVGFSGGYKYFFPGISGQVVIDVTHWLGALLTSDAIIGTKETPVRDAINRAASFINIPTICFNLVVQGHNLAGLYAGSPEESWSRAADLSAKLHVTYVDTPFRQVLSVMPEMYDDMWTAAKGMYKVSPVVEDGGEVIIYAPKITEFSYTYGHIIEGIGYHVRDYFVSQWDRFQHYPWGVLAHSTHLRGTGNYNAETELETPRIQATLSTGISREPCEKLNLGYRHPAFIQPDEWSQRQEEGILVVYSAGEQLYKLRA